jgi:hypothetical protein
MLEDALLTELYTDMEIRLMMEHDEQDEETRKSIELLVSLVLEE